MAVTLNASTTTGLVSTADTSGIITLQNNGTNALTVDSGNLQFNSGYGSVATAYGCRAWVNFNGTGTPAIIASGNVTSITDNGTGDYTVNFTVAFADTTYSPVGAGAGDYSATRGCMLTLERNAATGAEVTKTTSALRVNSVNDAGTGFDCKSVNVAIFR